MWLIMCANGTEENIFIAHNYYLLITIAAKQGDLHTAGNITAAPSLLCIHLDVK